MPKLRREKGVLNLTLDEVETSAGQVDTPVEVNSPPDKSLGTDISDPRILILSSAIKDTLSTSLSELIPFPCWQQISKLFQKSFLPCSLVLITEGAPRQVLVTERALCQSLLQLVPLLGPLQTQVSHT